MILPNAEPFFFKGNSTGCLLIHGYTASPTEMRPLGKYLARQGYTVLGVRLFGHATDISDLRRSRWQDWATSVLDGWFTLKSVTEDIFIMGLSTGGALALIHAATLPIRGVVGMSTPYQLGPDPRLVFLPLLSRIVPYLPKGGSDWVDPDAGKDRVSYSKYPTKGLLELSQLLEKMRETLPAVTVPALLLHSTGDGLFKPEHMWNIYHTLGTQEGRKTTVLLENSGHIITKDLEKMIVFRSIVEFIQQTLNQDQ